MVPVDSEVEEEAVEEEEDSEVETVDEVVVEEEEVSEEVTVEEVVVEEHVVAEVEASHPEQTVELSLSKKILLL